VDGLDGMVLPRLFLQGLEESTSEYSRIPGQDPWGTSYMCLSLQVALDTTRCHCESVVDMLKDSNIAELSMKFIPPHNAAQIWHCTNLVRLFLHDLLTQYFQSNLLQGHTL